MDLNEILDKAKSLVFDLSAAAKEKAEDVADQAKGLAEAAKAKVAILSEEEKIKKAELELGKLYYRDYAVGEEMDTAEYLPWCRKIDESNQLIAELKEKAENGKAAAEDEAEEVTRDIPCEEVTEDDFVVVCEEPAEAPAEEEPREETAE